MLLIGQARAQPSRTPLLVVYGVLAFLLLVGLHALNRRAAVRIERELDRLKDNE